VRWGLLVVLLAALAGVAHAQQDTRQQAVVPLPGGTQQRVEAVEATGQQRVEAVVLAPGEQQRVRAVVEPTPLEQFASHAAEAAAAIFGASVSIAMTVALLLFI
jgi:hypothetical protein